MDNLFSLLQPGYIIIRRDGTRAIVLRTTSGRLFTISGSGKTNDLSDIDRETLESKIYPVFSIDTIGIPRDYHTLSCFELDIVWTRLKPFNFRGTLYQISDDEIKNIKKQLGL